MQPFQTPGDPMKDLAAMAQQSQMPQQMPQGQPQQGQPQQQPQQPPAPISKDQVVAGLHHFGAVQKQMQKILAMPTIGKTNARPAIADATAQLMIDKILSLPEAMNALKLVPNDPGEQKAWVMTAIQNAKMAEQKVVHDYIAQGPGPEPQSPQGPWSKDNHKDHMGAVMAHYQAGG